VTVNVRVFVPSQSAGVSTTRDCVPEGVPYASVDPPSDTTAAESLTNVVTVMEVTLFATLSVYAVVDEVNAGFNDPELTVIASRVLSVSEAAALVTVIV
jgi:hypothetical protein